MLAHKTPDQIIRMDATGCMLEILNSSLDGYGKGKMGKVIFRLSKYDKDNVQTCLINHYIDISKFLGLVDDVRFGRIKQLASAERQAVARGERNFPNSIWEDFKTTDRTILRENGKSRPDGLDEVRSFEILPATKTKEPSFMLTALVCGGDKDKDGNIQKKVNYKQPSTYKKITVTVSETDFRDALKYAEMHIQAYFNRKWMQGAYDLESHTNEESAVNSNNVTNYRQSKPQSRTNNNRNTNAYTQAPSGPTARMNNFAPRPNTQGEMEITDEEEYPFSKAN